MAVASGFNDSKLSLGCSRRDFFSQNPLLGEDAGFSSGRSACGRIGGGGGETTALLLGDGECVDGVKAGLNSFAPGLNTNSFAPGFKFLVGGVGAAAGAAAAEATGTCFTIPGSRGVGLAIGDGTLPGVLV